MIASPLIRWLLGAALGLGLLAGAYAWITTGAYNRGVADTKAAMQRVLEKKAAEKREDRDAIRVLPDRDIDCELLRMRGERCD